MTLHVGEIGVTIVHGTSYDLSGATDLELYLIPPGGAVGDADVITVGTARISAPSVSYAAPAPISATFAADTYMQFTTLATDFVEASVAGGDDEGYDYRIYGRYTDGSLTLYTEPDYIKVHAVGS